MFLCFLCLRLHPSTARKKNLGSEKVAVLMQAKSVCCQIGTGTSALISADLCSAIFSFIVSHPWPASRVNVQYSSMSNASQKDFALQNSSHHLHLSLEGITTHAQHGFESFSVPGFRLQGSFAHLLLHLFDLAVFTNADNVG